MQANFLDNRWIAKSTDQPNGTTGYPVSNSGNPVFWFRNLSGKSNPGTRYLFRDVAALLSPHQCVLANHRKQGGYDFLTVLLILLYFFNFLTPLFGFFVNWFADFQFGPEICRRKSSLHYIKKSLYCNITEFWLRLWLLTIGPLKMEIAICLIRFTTCSKKKGVLLADGATGTNLFEMGLTSGQSPEFWNDSSPEKITRLHQDFVDAGSDIILTNSFGGTRHRLKLHNAQERVYELNEKAAKIARRVADGAGRKVIVGGSVGPTGELLKPLGELTYGGAVEAFVEQMQGLKAGGVDVCCGWKPCRRLMRCAPPLTGQPIRSTCPMS